MFPIMLKIYLEKLYQRKQTLSLRRQRLERCVKERGKLKKKNIMIKE